MVKQKLLDTAREGGHPIMPPFIYQIARYLSCHPSIEKIAAIADMGD